MNVARYQNTVDAIEAAMPGEGREHERRAAIDAAALYLVEDLDAERAGDDLHAAREAYEAAAAAARVFTLLAIEDGASEAGLARDLGVDRLTVRKWRGKQDRR
ncbi:HTH DNA binding protein [Mycobacterium phage Shandong1]|uniref:Helix-turn-helix DNA binding domain protein n=1 Tax=Mycobacterium phage Shandong1 TaxID=1983447 RepID=A0A1X9SHK0_9CAUD|nr:HTH DNA binding protein [Mycobacterium phage Shandong1]ARQ95477.1 hypothetical protein [Mycobacterium phage Shandong1]